MGKIRSHFTGPFVVTMATNLIASIQFGYTIGTASNTQDVVEDFINETLYDREDSYPSEDRVTDIWAAIVAIYYFGGGLGAIGLKWVSENMSRRRAYLYNIILGLVASAFLFASRRSEIWELLLVGRLLIGVHVGLNSGVIAIYLSEISPKEIRGAVCSSNPVLILVSLLVAQVFGFPDLLGTDDLWDILFGLSGVLCLAQLCFIPFSVESPRYLMINQKDEDAARKALRELRQYEDVEDEIDELREEMKTTTESVSILQLFKYPPYRRPTMLAISSQITIHLCGLNAVLFFSNSLFQETLDMSKANAAYLTSSFGVIGIIACLVVTPLSEMTGRRKLNLIGLIGLSICTGMTSGCLALRHEVEIFEYGAIFFLLSFMVFYISAPGVIPWIMIGEYFPQNIKPVASTISILANWWCGFGVAYVFPPMERAFGDYAFLPFCVFLVLCTIYTYFNQPETKGKTIQEIVEIFERSGHADNYSEHHVVSRQDSKEKEQGDDITLSSYL